MAESLLIFSCIVAIIGVILLIILYGREIGNIIFLLFGAILVIGGLALLVKVGGVLGALGIFIALWGGGIIYMVINDIRN